MPQTGAEGLTFSPFHIILLSISLPRSVYVLNIRFNIYLRLYHKYYVCVFAVAPPPDEEWGQPSRQSRSRGRWRWVRKVTSNYHHHDLAGRWKNVNVSCFPGGFSRYSHFFARILRMRSLKRKYLPHSFIAAAQRTSPQLGAKGLSIYACLFRRVAN